MAGVDAAMAPPQPPRPPRSGAAAAVATLRGLPAAADAVVCCYHGALWVSSAGNAALVALRRAFGNGSRAAAVAIDILLVVLGATVLLHFAVMLLLRSFETPKAEAREILIGGDGGAKRPGARRPESTGARGRQDGAYRLVAALMVTFMGLLMQVLAPAKESFQRRVGSMITDIGIFLYSVMFCFISAPKPLVQLRATYAKLKCGTA